MHLLPSKKNAENILPPVVLGRKLSYFPPAGGSGKKNSQTPISNSQTQISNLKNSQTQIASRKI